MVLHKNQSYLWYRYYLPSQSESHFYMSLTVLKTINICNKGMSFKTLYNFLPFPFFPSLRQHLSTYLYYISTEAKAKTKNKNLWLQLNHWLHIPRISVKTVLIFQHYTILFFFIFYFLVRRSGGSQSENANLSNVNFIVRNIRYDSWLTEKESLDPSLKF